jgi:hypothetical protein
VHGDRPDDEPGWNAPEDPRTGAIVRGVAISIGVLLLVGAGLLLLVPLDEAIHTPDDEPVWGAPGPIRGEPLEPGPCEGGVVVTDPASMAGDTARAALPEGLVLWLRSDHGVVRDPGDRVTSWRDLSSRGHDLVTPAGRPGPRWIVRAWRCLPALRFDGSASLLRSDVLGLAPDQPRTYVVVSRLRDTFERSQLFAQGESGSLFRQVGLEANTWQTAGSRFGLYVVDNAFDASMPTHRRLALHVLAIASLTLDRPLVGPEGGTPALRYWIDGSAQDLSLRSGTGRLREGLAGATRTSVGRFAGPGEYGYRGDVFEVQVYDRALDDAARGRIEARLAARYAVTPDLQ